MSSHSSRVKLDYRIVHGVTIWGTSLQLTLPTRSTVKSDSNRLPYAHGSAANRVRNCLESAVLSVSTATTSDVMMFSLGTETTHHCILQALIVIVCVIGNNPFHCPHVWNVTNSKCFRLQLQSRPHAPGPQEGVCNWCGQLGGRRVGKGVITITCAYPVPGKKINYRHREVRSGAILSSKGLT